MGFSTGEWVLCFYSALFLILLIFAIRYLRKEILAFKKGKKAENIKYFSKSLSFSSICGSIGLVILLVGELYANMVLFLGNRIGEGETLKGLSIGISTLHVVSFLQYLE